VLHASQLVGHAARLLYYYYNLFASRCAYKIDKLINIMRWQQGTTKATS